MLTSVLLILYSFHHLFSLQDLYWFSPCYSVWSSVASLTFISGDHVASPQHPCEGFKEQSKFRFILMGPRWRLMGSRELISEETFQQHEVKMSYNLPLDCRWNMKVQIPVHLHTHTHTKRNRSNILSFLALLFSCSVVSDSLRCHGLQHARLPCPSPSLTVCSQSCPLSR